MDGKLGNKRIRLAEAGENVLIPTLDTGSPFGPQNHLGVIPEIEMMGCIVYVLLQEYWTQCIWSASSNRQRPNLLRRRMFQTKCFTSRGNTPLLVCETQAGM